MIIPQLPYDIIIPQLPYDIVGMIISFLPISTQYKCVIPTLRNRYNRPFVKYSLEYQPFGNRGVFEMISSYITNLDNSSIINIKLDKFSNFYVRLSNMQIGFLMNNDNDHEFPKSIDVLVVAKNVTEILENSFDSFYKLKNIYFESGSKLKKIKYNAFKYSTISYLDFSNASKLECIDERAFEYCRDLKSIEFSKNQVLKSIGWQAYRCCDNLKEVKFHSICDMKGTFYGNLRDDCYFSKSHSFPEITNIVVV